MDPIKNMISGIDPLHHRDARVPDGEEALRRMFSEPAAFTDTRPPKIVSLAERRQRRAKIAGLLTIAAAAVTAGVLVSINLGPLTAVPAPANTGTSSVTQSASTSPSPSVTPSASATPATATPPPTSGPALPSTAPSPVWGRYETPDALLSFETPPGWTVVENAVDGATPSIQIVIMNDAGARVAGLDYANSGLGGACGPAPVPLLTLDSQPDDVSYRVVDGYGAPEFVFRVMDATGLGGSVVGAAGLIQQQQQPQSEACMMYTTMYGPQATLAFTTKLQANATDTDGLVFESVAAAKAYMGSEEYLSLKRMFTSLTLQ